MNYTDNQWKIFWWINDNFPKYKSSSPEEHLKIIKMIELYNNYKSKVQ